MPFRFAPKPRLYGAKVKLALAILMACASAAIWMPQNAIWLWKLSLITTALGPALALVPGIALLRLIRGQQRLCLTVAMIALACFVSIGFLLAPLVSVARHEAAWRAAVESASKKEGASPLTDSWLSWRQLLPFSTAGSLRPSTTFVYTLPSAPIELKLDYYKPEKSPDAATVRADAASGQPWVMIVHGGSWSGGDRNQVPELNSILAKRGIGVIEIDYRLAPQWKWPAQKIDALQALAFVRSHAIEWRLDPQRWGLLGRSAGGQIAGVIAYAADVPTPAAKALVSMYAPTDMTFGYEVGEEDDILSSRALLRDFLGGAPFEKVELYASASPLDFIGTSSPATLLLHGHRDSLVWRKHSERLYSRLQALRVPSALIEFDFGPHGFDYFPQSAEGAVANEAIAAFLKRVL